MTKRVCKNVFKSNTSKRIRSNKKKYIFKVEIKKKINEFDTFLNECGKYQPFDLKNIDFNFKYQVDELDMFINECSKFQAFEYRYIDIKKSNNIYLYDLKYIKLDMDDLLNKIQKKRSLEKRYFNK